MLLGFHRRLLCGIFGRGGQVGQTLPESHFLLSLLLQGVGHLLDRLPVRLLLPQLFGLPSEVLLFVVNASHFVQGPLLTLFRRPDLLGQTVEIIGRTFGGIGGPLCRFGQHLRFVLQQLLDRFLPLPNSLLLGILGIVRHIQLGRCRLQGRLLER